ncbi:ribonuclease H-like domain-containing protein [Tanacetum coccineum]
MLILPGRFMIPSRAPGTWTQHQRLGHPGGEVLRHLVSSNFISYNKEKPPVLCHACQLGKHVNLPFVSSSTVISSCFDIINSDVWTSPIPSLSDGTLSRYKARLMANGSTQLEGVDVDETFSPVIKSGTIQTFLSLDASRHWPIHQLDVKNAFSRGDLSEIVYMHQPPGFWDSVHPDYGTDTAYLLLYVDDIVLTASFEILLQQIIRSLHQEFAMTDLGSLNYFLGISVTRDPLGLFLSQKKYVVEILDRAHMVNCNPSRTPIGTKSKLGSDGDPISDPTLYRSLAGSLQYLTFTRPDISYVVQKLFSSSTTDVVVYSDADWAGCPTTRRSTSGYCVFLGNNLLSWSSKRQPTLSRSSAEAEYRGVANVVAETCWLRNLLRELYTLLSSATLVYCDNVSVVYLSCNPFQHQRTKHIEIDIHFVRDLVAAGEDLVGALQTALVSHNCKDRWRWTIFDDGEFKVKELSRMIEEKILFVEHRTQETLWNKLVPKKVNMFMWRALKGRLPIRDELDKRGIESCAHCLVTSDLAMAVWDKVFCWWKMGCVNAFSVGEFFSSNGNINVPSGIRRVWQVVIWTSGYFIWKERNARVFGKKSIKYK